MAYSHAYLNAVDLGQDVYWQDEYDWTPHAQTVRKAVDGALVVERLPSYADGQPLTVFCSWVPKTVVDAVIVLRDKLNPTVMTLTLADGRIYDVLFRHQDGPPISVVPIVERPDYINQVSPDYYDLTIRLFEVPGMTTTTT